MADLLPWAFRHRQPIRPGGNGATVTLDEATSSTGPWTTGYATGTLANGQATLTGTALPAGTWWLRARVTDLAGNEGTSAAQSVVISSATTWGGSLQTLNFDGVQGDWLAGLGDVSLVHPLLLDQSGSPARAGNPALVYHSAQVGDKPIVQLQLQSPNDAGLPGTVSARLTFNSVAGTTITYNTFGIVAGETLTLALQNDMAITSSGLYSYSVTVSAGTFNNTYSGSVYLHLVRMAY